MKLARPRTDANYNPLDLFDYDPQNHVQVEGCAPDNINTVYTPSAVGKEVVGLFLSMFNGTSGSIDVAMGPDLADSKWEAGQWVNASNTYTVDTTDAQDADAGDFALTTTTIRDGWVAGATEKFSAVEIVVSTVGSFGAGTQTTSLEYWDGSTFSTFSGGSIVKNASLNGGTARTERLVFRPPLDWAMGGPTAAFSSSKYYIRVRYVTTAPTVAALAITLNLLHLLKFHQPSLASGDTVSYDEAPFLFSQPADVNAEPIKSYFESANMANYVTFKGVEVSTATIS